MKYCNGVLTFIFLMQFFVCPMKAQQELLYGIYTGTETLHEMGTQKAETYDIAMHLQDPALVGMQIVGINVPINTGVNITDCKAWLTKQLTLESSSNVPDITSIDFTPEGNWVKVTFAEPYTITEEGVYAGYSLTVPSVEADNAADPNKVPIMCIANEDIGNLYMHTSRSVRKWRPLAETAYYATGAYAFFVRLSGEQIKTHAASLLTPDEKDCFSIINTERTLDLTVVNHGLSEITNIDYEILFDHEKIEHHVDISLHGLYYGAKANLNIELPVVTNKGPQPVNVRITKVNGVGNEDGTPNVSFNIYYLNEYPKHKPLMETYTGTWCGWCTREHASMNAMSELYGDDFVGISYHNGDAMVCTYSYPNDVNSFPNCFIDRIQEADCFYGSSNQSLGIKEDWNARRTIVAPASVSLEAHWADESLTHLQVTSTTTFICDFADSPYQLTYILTEDKMTGSGSGWSQGNYLANMADVANDPYLGPYTNMPSSISGLEFNNVAIQLASSKALALENTLPTTITAETQYNHTYTFDISQNDLVQDKRYLRPVVLLINKSTGEVVNAEKISVDITNVIPSKYTLDISVSDGAFKPELSHLYDRDGNEYDVTDFSHNEFEEGSYIRIVPNIIPYNLFYIREIIVNGESVGTWTDERTAPTEYVIEKLSGNTTVEFKTYYIEQIRTLGCIAKGPGKVEMYRNGNYVGVTSTDNPYDTHINLVTDVFEEGDVLKLVFVPDEGSTLAGFCGGPNDSGVEDVGLLADVMDNTYTITFPYIYQNDYPLLRCFTATFEGSETPEPTTNNTLSAIVPTLLLGKQATLSLNLTNEDELIACEFDLQLPDGITIAKDEDGDPIAMVSSRASKHSLAVSDQGNGLYHFLCYSGENKIFSGNEGELLSIELLCDGNMAVGTYQATVKNIIFSDVDKNKITPVDYTFDLEVIEAEPGDVNNDGDINVMDVVEMVSYIMGQGSEGFVFAAADLYTDGAINVMDLVNLVDLIMHPTASSNAMGWTENGMSLSTMADGAVAVKVNNPEQYVASEFIVEVSAGQTLEAVTVDKHHRATCSQLDDSHYKVMTYSSENSTYSGDALVQLHISGEGMVNVHDALLVDESRKGVAFAPTAGGYTTGINQMENGKLIIENSSVYDLQGKKRDTSRPYKHEVLIVNGKKQVVR